LRFILRHCDVRTSTPHSSGFARLASGAFYFVVSIMTFYEFIKVDESVKRRILIFYEVGKFGISRAGGKWFAIHPFIMITGKPWKSV